MGWGGGGYTHDSFFQYIFYITINSFLNVNVGTIMFATGKSMCVGGGGGGLLIPS